MITHCCRPCCDSDTGVELAFSVWQPTSASRKVCMFSCFAASLVLPSSFSPLFLKSHHHRPHSLCLFRLWLFCFFFSFCCLRSSELHFPICLRFKRLLLLLFIIIVFIIWRQGFSMCSPDYPVLCRPVWPWADRDLSAGIKGVRYCCHYHLAEIISYISQHSPFSGFNLQSWLANSTTVRPRTFLLPWEETMLLTSSLQAL